MTWWRRIKRLFATAAPTPCRYCTNADRDAVFSDMSLCQWKNPNPGNGSDPPCICDPYGTERYR